MNLKFRVKLNHSNSIRKYRYQIAIDEEDLLTVQDFKIYNVKKKENKIIFNCQKDTLKSLKQLDIKYEVEDKISNFINKNKIKISISLIFLMLILSIYTLNQFLIREISFTNQDYYNYEIYEYVSHNVKKIGPFYFLEDSINEISKNMRQEFYEYAYVGLSKKGSKLLIEVEIQEVPKTIDEKKIQIGEFFAKEDATIIEINLSSGQMVVSHNDVVKKGDLIATSNLQYKDNLYSLDKMVPLVGTIIGKTIRYSDIEIYKQEEIEVFTNRIYQYYTFVTSNKVLFVKENPFNNSYQKSKQIFKVGDLGICKNTIYERKKELVNRTYEEAIELSRVLINQSFELNRTSNSEKIVSLNLISYEENDEKYIFKYLICAYQNIAEFKKFIEVNK